MQLAFLVFSVKAPQRTPTSIVAVSLSLVVSLFMGPLSYTEHTKCLRTSDLLNGYLFLSALFDAVQARTLWLDHQSKAHNTPVHCFFAALVVKLVLILLESDGKSNT